MGLAEHGHDATLDDDFPKDSPLTIENIRKIKGYETISEEEALEIIRSLDLYARIVLSACGKLNSE